MFSNCCVRSQRTGRCSGGHCARLPLIVFNRGRAIIASMTTSDDPILKRFRDALDEMYGDRLERVVLYGSRARGDAREDSDYDPVFLYLVSAPSLPISVFAASITQPASTRGLQRVRSLQEPSDYWKDGKVLCMKALSHQQDNKYRSTKQQVSTQYLCASSFVNVAAPSSVLRERKTNTLNGALAITTF